MLLKDRRRGSLLLVPLGFQTKFVRFEAKKSDAFPKPKSCKYHLGSESQARSFLACAFSSAILACRISNLVSEDAGKLQAAMHEKMGVLQVNLIIPSTEKVGVNKAQLTLH